MDVEVNSRAAFRWCRVASARTHQVVGWPGLTGLALLIAAGAVMLPVITSEAPTKLESSDAAPLLTNDPASAAAALTSAEGEIAVARLRDRREVSAILTRIGEVSSAAGLGWPAAEYSLLAATESQSPSMEVRCTLKGQYPQIRAMLAKLLRTIPGVTLRELTISRTNSDSLAVEARMVLAILLEDDAVTTTEYSSDAR